MFADRFAELKWLWFRGQPVRLTQMPGASSAVDGDGCRRPLAGPDRHGQPGPDTGDR